MGEIFGRTAGEMIGGTEELSCPREMARKVRELDRRLFEGKDKQYQGLEQHMTRDGRREHTFLVTRTQFRFGGENLMLNSVLDVSDLKETQTSCCGSRTNWRAKIWCSLRC